jgi:hypothetical protein
MKFIGLQHMSEHELHKLKMLVYLRLTYSLYVHNIYSKRNSP